MDCDGRMLDIRSIRTELDPSVDGHCIYLVKLFHYLYSISLSGLHGRDGQPSRLLQGRRETGGLSARRVRRLYGEDLHHPDVVLDPPVEVVFRLEPELLPRARYVVDAVRVVVPAEVVEAGAHLDHGVREDALYGVAKIEERVSLACAYVEDVARQVFRQAGQGDAFRRVPVVDHVVLLLCPFRVPDRPTEHRVLDHAAVDRVGRRPVEELAGTPGRGEPQDDAVEALLLPVPVDEFFAKKLRQAVVPHALARRIVLRQRFVRGVAVLA